MNAEASSISYRSDPVVFFSADHSLVPNGITPIVAADEIDLLAYSLPLPGGLVSDRIALLPGEERERAERYQSARARSAFLAGRIILRELIARYLDIRVEQVRLRIGAQGKPTLRGAHPLGFNLAHTEGLILLGFSSGLALGVDVEKVRPVDGIARFLHGDIPRVGRSADLDSQEGILRQWTDRESVVKALGTGISLGWERVNLVERNPLEFDASGLEVPCHVRRLTPVAGYVASVCALSRDFRIRQTWISSTTLQNGK